MIPQNPPRKHHYIPIFYSKQWCGADGRIERFTREWGRLVDRRVHPARVGWELDLYKVPGEDGPDAQRMEAMFFSQLDCRADAVLRKLLAHPVLRLNDLDAGHWIIFMRSLLHRSPTEIAAFKERGRDIWWSAIRNSESRYAELRAASDPVSHSEYLALRKDEEGAARSLETLPGVLGSEAVMRILAEAPWRIYDVPAGGPRLLLSDAPIARTNGFEVEGGHIAMPLSPTRFLLIARDAAVAAAIERVPVKQLVKGLNRATITQARHFVAAQDRTQLLFISKHFKPVA